VILHASRSGQRVNRYTGAAWTQLDEFDSTRGYASRGAAGLFWNWTAGPHRFSRHANKAWVPRYNRYLLPWGYNARYHSSEYAAIEIAQANLGDHVSEDTLWTVAWIIKNEFLPLYPGLTIGTIQLPEHWELPAGRADGKTDMWYNQPGVLAERVRNLMREL